MNRRLVVTLALAFALSAVPLADAEPGKAKSDHGKKKGHAKWDVPAPEPETATAPPVEPDPAPTGAPLPAPRADAPPPAALADDAPAAAPRAPTPVPERRVAAMEEALVVQARVPVARPAPHAHEDAGAAPGSASPWSWALPILGLVGAALATTRPGSVTLTSAKPLAYLTATPTVAGLLRAGKAAVEASRFEEAIAWFTQALKLDPRVAVAHFCSGVCHAALGRHEDAYASLRKAHRLDPAEGAYRLELARAAARTGRSREAMDAIAPVLRALPALAEDAADDDAFASLRDHPRWLAMLGRL